MAKIIDDRLDLSAYGSEPEGSEHIVPAGAILEQMRAQVGKPKSEEETGLELPWEGLADRFRLRQGEFTLWAGANGSGKSTLTAFVGVHLLARRQKVCIASFEMKPPATVARMLRQFSGRNVVDSPVRHERDRRGILDAYRDFESQCDDLLWLYSQVGSTDAGTITKLARYCARKLGIQHLVIDNLAKVVRGADDYSGQKAFADELFAITKDHGMAVHLVHHVKKLESEDRLPGKWDIKGAGEVTDVVDNVGIVWRNKTPPAQRTEPQFDTVLNIVKQRHGPGWEGRIGLYFDPDSQQFTRERGRLIDFARSVA